MCTYIVETAPVDGSAKAGGAWFGIERASVAYDHPAHVEVEHAVLLDFHGADGRLGVELTLEAAGELARALAAAIERAQRYDAA